MNTAGWMDIDPGFRLPSILNSQLLFNFRHLFQTHSCHSVFPSPSLNPKFTKYCLTMGYV